MPTSFNLFFYFYLDSFFNLYQTYPTIHWKIIMVEYIYYKELIWRRFFFLERYFQVNWRNNRLEYIYIYIYIYIYWFDRIVEFWWFFFSSTWKLFLKVFFTIEMPLLDGLVDNIKMDYFLKCINNFKTIY